MKHKIRDGIIHFSKKIWVLHLFIFQKFICNVAYSGPCSVFKKTIGEILANDEMKNISLGCAFEARKIGDYKKINFSFKNTEKYVLDFGNKMPLSKPSMLQDVEAKRKCELSSINGMVVTLGKELEIDTPYNKVITTIISTREKNYLNTSSALIKQSIHEMEVFVEHLKGKRETVKGLAGLGDLYVSSVGGRNAKMGSYIGEGLTFSEAKKTKMEKVTVEGADLAIEIAKKVNEDFDNKKLPLMLAMINAIVEDKKLELNWEAFR